MELKKVKKISHKILLGGLLMKPLEVCRPHDLVLQTTYRLHFSAFTTGNFHIYSKKPIM